MPGWPLLARVPLGSEGGALGFEVLSGVPSMPLVSSRATAWGGGGVPLTPSASLNGIRNRQQPPPTASATSSNRLSNRLWGRLRGPLPSNASLVAALPVPPPPPRHPLATLPSPSSTGPSSSAWSPHRPHSGTALGAGAGAGFGTPAKPPKPGPRAAPAPPPDPAAALRDFTSWCADARVDSPALDLRADPAAAGGRGTFATRPVRPGDVLVRLPRSAVLNVVAGAETPFPDFVPERVWQALPWQPRLACALLHEGRRGAASPYAPYLAQLPRAIPRAPRLAQADLAACAYPPLARRVAEERAAAASWLKALRAGGADVRPAEFDWALDCVFSRAFSGPLGDADAGGFPLALRAGFVGAGLFAAATTDEPGLKAAAAAVVAATVAYDFIGGGGGGDGGAEEAGRTCYGLFPMVDAINHKTRAATRIAHDGPADAFTLAADGAAEAGAEVFVSYGPLDNDELLMRYGFVEAGNPADVYVFEDLRRRVASGASKAGPAVRAALGRDGKLDAGAGAWLRDAVGAEEKRVLCEAVAAELQAIEGAPAARAGSENARLVAAFREAKQSVLRDALAALQ